MRILHTSDWHIGKKLYNHDMGEVHRQFLDWLLETIREQQVEALLVAGDVFDTGYPSNAALKLYYQFLTRLQDTPCRQVIITGGNHDSVSTLEAPREVLKFLNVHVIGGAGEDKERLLVPLYNQAGEAAGLVAAVPFLRDRDIRRSVPGESSRERVEMIRQGIIGFYREVADVIQRKYSGIRPLIAMGHLFMHKASTSDSEREVQIGNLGSVQAGELPEIFDYWALGHIHRPQRVAGSSRMRYSGSPIPLSFSEYKDAKQALLLDVEEGKLSEPQQLHVPVFCKLVRINGNYQEVTRKLNEWPANGETRVWADVEVVEENHQPELVRQFRELVEHTQQPEILNYKIRFTGQAGGADELYEHTRALSELKASDVFEKKLDYEGVDEEQQERLKQAFQELLHQMDNQ